MDGGISTFSLPLSAWTPHPSPGQLSPWSVEQVACFHKHEGDGASPVEADPLKNLNENETGLIFTLAQPQLSPNSPLFCVFQLGLVC